MINVNYLVNADETKTRQVMEFDTMGEMQAFVSRGEFTILSITGVLETKTTKYNGYTNYETWAVKLWIDNDQGLYDMFRDLSVDIFIKNPDYNVHGLAVVIEEKIKELAPELPASVYSDLLNSALSNVNWYEIADTIYHG